MVQGVEQVKSGEQSKRSRSQAMVAWAFMTQALQGSDAPEDKALAEQIARFVRKTPYSRKSSNASSARQCRQANNDLSRCNHMTYPRRGPRSTWSAERLHSVFALDQSVPVIN